MIRGKAKSYLLNYYDSYAGDKTNFKCFYGRCRDRDLLKDCFKGKRDNELKECIGVAIKRRESYGFKGSKQFPEAFAFYYSYKGEKPSSVVFRARLVNGYSMYDAIKTGEEFEQIRKAKRKGSYEYSVAIKKAREDCRVRQLMAGVTVEQPVSYIDIKYTREEANVFRKVFEDEIEKLEYEATLDTTDKALRDKLASLEKEFEVFQKHNFIS